MIIDHLFYIFRPILEHDIYHPQWLESTTLVLRKIGKPTYHVAKAYHLIGLIDTIPGLFSSLCSRHTSCLAEKHNLLPPTQFGGRPGRNTTDAMLLVTHKIKDPWRKGKSAAALFLSTRNLPKHSQGTAHTQHVHVVHAKLFINIVSLLLTSHTTCLKFNDYSSEPIPLNNGMTRKPIIDALLLLL